MDKDIQVVGLRIGRETFGIPIGMVREIVRVPEITSVPNAPDYIEGVINLRGRIVPVVDLRKRFREVVAAPNKKNRIVVVELDGRPIGLIVNSASEVLKIPGRLVILLDLSRILQRGELRRLDEVAETAAPVPAGVTARR